LDYLSDAFGRFDPQNDPCMAVKFSLNLILMDARLTELGNLLTDGNEVSELEGEPGWIIERRDTGPAGERPWFADWLPGKNFRVEVDPRSFSLEYPTQFLTKDEFHDYVKKAMVAYVKHNPLILSKLPATLSKFVA